MNEYDKLNSGAHQQILESAILPDSGVDYKASHQRPRAIILAGQPGAGKGALAATAEAELNRDVVTVDPDALRYYHPEIECFRSEDPCTWAG